MINPTVPLYTGSGALFRNCNHPESDLVEKVFTTTDPARTFGYPCRLPSDHENAVHVTYRFQCPEKVFNKKGACCAPCLSYSAKNVDAAAVGKHFGKCWRAVRTLFRFSISLHMEALDNLGWSVEDIALAWFEAAGQDAQECLNMIGEGSLTVSDSGFTTHEIVQYIDMLDNMMKLSRVDLVHEKLAQIDVWCGL